MAPATTWELCARSQRFFVVAAVTTSGGDSTKSGCTQCKLLLRLWHPVDIDMWRHCPGQLLHHSTCRPPVQRWSGRASTCGTLHFGCSNKTLPQICSGTATATGVTTTMQPQPCVLWLVSIIVRICVANHCLICAARFFVPIRLT